jgi:hypothetical protein
VAKGIVSCCPTLSRVLVKPLASIIALTALPYLAAMSYSVSPAWTLWMNGVAVTDGVSVSVSIIVAIGLGEGVGVLVRVGIELGVGVAVLVGVGVELDVGVAVLVGVGERVGVRVQVGVDVGLGLCVAVGIRVDRGVRDGAFVGVSISAGVAATSLVTRSVDTIIGCWVQSCRRSQAAAVSSSTSPITITRMINPRRIQLPFRGSSQATHICWLRLFTVPQWRQRTRRTRL